MKDLIYAYRLLYLHCNYTIKTSPVIRKNPSLILCSEMSTYILQQFASFTYTKRNIRAVFRYVTVKSFGLRVIFVLIFHCEFELITQGTIFGYTHCH